MKTLYFIFCLFPCFAFSQHASPQSCKGVFLSSKFVSQAEKEKSSAKKEIQADFEKLFETEPFNQEKYSVISIKKAMNTLDYRKNMDQYPPLSWNKQKQLLQIYQLNKSERAYNILFLSNMKLVLYVMNKYLIREADFEDYFQQGLIGLIKSIRQFDFSRGANFSTVAVIHIKAHILNYMFRDKLIPVKLQLRKIDLFSKIQKEKRELIQGFGTEEWIKSFLEKNPKYSSEEVRLVLDLLSRKVMSLNAKISDDGLKTFIDYLPSNENIGEDIITRMDLDNMKTYIIKQVKKETLKKLLALKRDMEIIKKQSLFRGLISREELNKRFALSEKHIENLEHKYHKKTGDKFSLEEVWNYMLSDWEERISKHLRDEKRAIKIIEERIFSESPVPKVTIGKEFGITRERIYAIEKRLRDKIHKKFASNKQQNGELEQQEKGGYY